SLWEQNLLGPDLTGMSIRLQIVDAGGNDSTAATVRLLPTQFAGFELLRDSNAGAYWSAATAADSGSSLWFRSTTASVNSLPAGQVLYRPLLLTPTGDAATSFRIKYEVFSVECDPVTPELSPTYWACPSFSETLVIG